MTRIRLRPGLHYAPVAGGVYLSSARASFVMSGPAVLFRVVDACVPVLEGGSDIDQLVTAVGAPAARPLVEHLVRTLEARGLLLRTDELDGGQPDPADRARFAEALAYLETNQAQPYADFRRIRAAHVLVAGPHEALGPAIRGLLRAGCGRVTAATCEPARLAALASRHPQVRVVAWSEGEALPAEGADAPDAAVICSSDQFPEMAMAALPAGCVAVPVRLGKDVAIVGPAFVARDGAHDIASLWERASAWCRGDGAELRVRPSGDLLAGALAGQAAFDGLVGLNGGQVHLVHGADLSADCIVAAPPAAPGGGDGDWTARLSAPWSGLFRLYVPGDLPQLPLALTLAEGRSPWFEGRAFGFGPDQDASTTEAALEGLRHHCDGVCRSESDEWADQPVSAAGLDETDWRLDGALRLLARRPGDETTLDWLGVDDVEARRLWRAIEEYELVPVVVTLRRLPDFAWILGSVHNRRSGQLIAQGWGPGAGSAAATALSAALASVQVGRCLPDSHPTAGGSPGWHHRLHRPARDQLDVALRHWQAATGHHLTARRVASDPVTGMFGAWCGPVGLHESVER